MGGLHTDPIAPVFLGVTGIRCFAVLGCFATRRWPRVRQRGEPLGGGSRYAPAWRGRHYLRLDWQEPRRHQRCPVLGGRVDGHSDFLDHTAVVEACATAWRLPGPRAALNGLQRSCFSIRLTASESPVSMGCLTTDLATSPPKSRHARDLPLRRNGRQRIPASKSFPQTK